MGLYLERYRRKFKALSCYLSGATDQSAENFSRVYQYLIWDSKLGNFAVEVFVLPTRQGRLKCLVAEK